MRACRAHRAERKPAWEPDREVPDREVPDRGMPAWESAREVPAWEPAREKPLPQPARARAQACGRERGLRAGRTAYANPMNLTSGDSSMPYSSNTLLWASSISARTSRAVALPLFTIKLACTVEI